jgi:hypothetical protein
MRRTLPFAMGLLLAAAACGPGQVVVTMEIQNDNPDGGTTTQALSDIEVQLLPFDRDSVFDSLTAAYPEPEPQVPAALSQARQLVEQAQGQYDQAQRRWATLRDTLQKISTTMQKYNRGEAQYLLLYKDFQDFDGQLSGAEKAMNSAFSKFDSLQQGTMHESDSIRVLQENWADEAFTAVDSVYMNKEAASGLQVAVDTTDANGVARDNFKVKPGKYWVYARYRETYSELYWNVPINVERGDPVQVKLDRSNAVERPVL